MPVPMPFGVLEKHVRQARDKKPYSQRPRRRGLLRARPFGGINTVLCGDWWQLPPVKQVSLCSNPFDVKSHQSQRMQAMFWTRGPNTIQTLFELDENKRNGEDQWLAGFLAECRAGDLCWENYSFMHGYATQAPGSWMNIANDADHGARHVARDTREARRRAADGGLMSTITEATGAKGPAAPAAACSKSAHAKSNVDIATRRAS